VTFRVTRMVALPVRRPPRPPRAYDRGVDDKRPTVPTPSTVYRLGFVPTVLIWVLMVATFVGVYNLMTSNPSPWGTLAIVGSILALLFAMGSIGVLRTNRQLRRFASDINDGVAALGRGDLTLAHKLFWKWSERATVPRASALARHNLAWTQMRQGELARAIATLTDNEARHEGPLKAISMHATSAADLALCHALAGQVAEAEAWLVKAEQRSSARSIPSVPAMLAYARAVIDCRTGNCAEAARLLDERWAECEASLTGEVVRPLRVIRAFAHAAAGPRSAGVADAILATAKPTAYPIEYEFLSATWPEMASFLAAQNLTRIA
jgi:hypothetical protein